MAARGIPRLFVGNVPWSVGRKELREYFSQFGQIQGVNVFFDKETGMNRGFGFIQFGTREGYLNSAREQSHFLEGNRLAVTDVNAAGSAVRTPNQKGNFGRSSSGSGDATQRRPSTTNINHILSGTKDERAAGPV